MLLISSLLTFSSDAVWSQANYAVVVKNKCNKTPCLSAILNSKGNSRRDVLCAAAAGAPAFDFFTCVEKQLAETGCSDDPIVGAGVKHLREICIRLPFVPKKYYDEVRCTTKGSQTNTTIGPTTLSVGPRPTVLKPGRMFLKVSGQHQLLRLTKVTSTLRTLAGRSYGKEHGKLHRRCYYLSCVVWKRRKK